MMWFSKCKDASVMGSFRVLKFNVDGVAKGIAGLAGIGGVLCNNKREVLMLFTECIGAKEPNKAEVMATLEALRMFVFYYQDKLVVDSDSSNAIA